MMVVMMMKMPRFEVTWWLEQSLKTITIISTTFITVVIIIIILVLCRWFHIDDSVSVFLRAGERANRRMLLQVGFMSVITDAIITVAIIITGTIVITTVFPSLHCNQYHVFQDNSGRTVREQHLLCGHNRHWVAEAVLLPRRATCRQPVHPSQCREVRGNNYYRGGQSIHFQSIHPSIQQPTRLSVHLSIHPSIHPSIHTYIHPTAHLSIHPFVHPSIHWSNNSCTNSCDYFVLNVSIASLVHRLNIRLTFDGYDDDDGGGGGGDDGGINGDGDDEVDDEFFWSSTAGTEFPSKASNI